MIRFRSSPSRLVEARLAMQRSRLDTNPGRAGHAQQLTTIPRDTMNANSGDLAGIMGDSVALRHGQRCTP